MSASSPFVSVCASPAAARVAPFALFLGLLALESLAGERAGDLRWLTILRPLLVACLLAYLWKHYKELHARPRVAKREWMVAIALGLSAFAAWIAFDHGWAVIGRGGAGFAPTTEDGRIDLTLALLRLAGFALVVPVMEELFWRSYVLRRIDARDFLSIDPRAASLMAVAVSS